MPVQLPLLCGVSFGVAKYSLVHRLYRILPIFTRARLEMSLLRLPSYQSVENSGKFVQQNGYSFGAIEGDVELELRLPNTIFSDCPYGA